MPFACSYEVPADERLYATVKAEIGDDRMDGLIVHLVVKSDLGLRHTTVWESQADWERFRDGRLQPAVAKALTAAGFAQLPPPPVVDELDVVDVVIAGASRTPV